MIEKRRDVVGLYLSPPQKALVLCVDEKSQCQAMERTPPMLPMGFGDVEGATHDDTRHGTINQAIRRGSFTSVKQLVQRIDHFGTAHNADCQPFKWAATPIRS